MKPKQFVYLLLFAFPLLLLQSCGSSSGDQEKNSEEFKEAGENVDEQIESVVYNIPSPTEIPYIIQQTGAEFNEGLLNPTSSVDAYLSHTDKAALNLGVYATDIGYLSSYEKTQEAIDYLSECKKLAEELNVIGSFDIEVLKKFESNISNKDSLAIILDKAIHQTDKYLHNDSRNKLAALVIAGSFIEGLYISTGLVEAFPKNILKDDDRNLVLTPLIRVILQQEKSVAELLKMMGTVEQTEPVAAIVTDLKSLDSAYKGLNIDKQIQENKGYMVLSDKNLVEISQIVKKLRTDITQ